MTDNINKLKDEHFRQLNAYRDLPAYKEADDYEARAAFFATTVGRKWEIDAELYEEFLNILPPIGWRGDSFHMGEFLFDDITHKYSREDDRYFCEVVYYPLRPDRAAKASAAPGKPAPGDG